MIWQTCDPIYIYWEPSWRCWGSLKTLGLRISAWFMVTMKTVICDIDSYLFTIAFTNGNIAFTHQKRAIVPLLAYIYNLYFIFRNPSKFTNSLKSLTSLTKREKKKLLSFLRLDSRHRLALLPARQTDVLRVRPMKQLINYKFWYIFWESHFWWTLIAILHSNLL